MARLLIIGYGNPLRGDDGLGWRAAEDLAREFPNVNVEIRTCHQLVPEHVDLVSRAETTFFIDAAEDGEPGEVKCAPVAPQRETSSSSHQLSPAAILAWSRELYGRHPRGFALSICGGCFEMGEKLSPAVAASLPHLTALARQMAHRLSRFSMPAPVRSDR